MLSYWGGGAPAYFNVDAPPPVNLPQGGAMLYVNLTSPPPPPQTPPVGELDQELHPNVGVVLFY